MHSFMSVFMCSYGCAGIREVTWALHGHYEEEYYPLRRAAGDIVWFEFGPDRSRQLGTEHCSVFSDQDTERPPISNNATPHK